MAKKTPLQLKVRRINRIRYKIYGTSERPRLAVFRSLRHISGQLIDDKAKKTILACSDLGMSNKKDIKPSDIALEVGTKLGKLAFEKKIKTCVFDRRSYKYHGRVKQFAEGARSAGLKF